MRVRAERPAAGGPMSASGARASARARAMRTTWSTASACSGRSTPCADATRSRSACTSGQKVKNNIYINKMSFVGFKSVTGGRDLHSRPSQRRRKGGACRAEGGGGDLQRADGRQRGVPSVLREERPEQCPAVPVDLTLTTDGAGDGAVRPAWSARRVACHREAAQRQRARLLGLQPLDQRAPRLTWREASVR
jgi:hypothetical protein